jgi:uncharacterized protein (DUF4213/DUF364 family)
MRIIKDIITCIREDAPVAEVRACVFWTAVVSKGCGLASTVREEGPHHAGNPVGEAGSLTEKTALELAQHAFSTSLPEASIGMAAINSLIDIDSNRCVERNAFEILKEKGQGEKVAIVGHFPFIPKLQRAASELWVLEKLPIEGDLPEDRSGEILTKADVVGITGTTLINHTFEGLMDLCREKFVVVLGPSTPLSPVLFDYGVDVLSGVEVTDSDSVIRSISEGASFRQITGVKLLTMSR